MDDFVSIGAFSTHCPAELDVTPDNDPNSPTFNGYKNVRAMTLRDAMKLVWLFKEADFSGSVTASASANNSGSITDNTVSPPSTNNYSSSVSDSYSYTWTTSTSTNPPTAGKQTTNSIEPKLRVCKDGAFRQSDESDIEFDSSNDGTSSNSRSSVDFSVDALDSSGQTQFCTCLINLPKLSDIRRFISDGEFIGYGFQGFIFTANLLASIHAGTTFPQSHRGNKPNFSNINGFGDFFISCFTFENDDGEYAGFDSDSEVEVGGIPLYAQCIGTTITEFSDTDTSVRFSINKTVDNTGGVLNYSQPSSTVQGATIDYNYTYNTSCSMTANMDFDGITFYQ